MISAQVMALLWVAGFVAVYATIRALDLRRSRRATRAQRLIEAGSPYLDVDSLVDYEREHPAGSVSMPCPYVVYLASRLDRRVPLVVHGHFFRAMLASYRLRKAGFRVLSVGSLQAEG
jgi:hypothetical protein